MGMSRVSTTMLGLGLVVAILTQVALGTEESSSPKRQYLTGETGHRTGSNQDSQAATETGGLLLQDVYALEKLRRFNSERIPERVVHARGAGAHGVFVSTADSSNYTMANFLGAEGRETEVFVRFSTVAHGRDSPETLRDPRGFAVKYYTEDGIYDLVGNNLPVFFIRDHLKFPDLIHASRPSPVTNRQDPNRVFDFFSALGGMATHMLTNVFSDLGIPKSYRFMDGNGVHAYKMVNAERKVTYVKFRWTSLQGVQNLTEAEAAEIQGSNFGHATQDLYDAISNGDFPSWDLSIQTMDPSQLNDFDFNPLDATKVWPEDKFPLKKIGRMTLNRVPDNFFLSSEQSAFDPGNFLPGAIEPSEDRLLQGRLISYHETQVHRLGGAGFQDLPINRAKSPIRNYNMDGFLAHNHAWGGNISDPEVNYEPSNSPDAFREDKRFLYSPFEVCGPYTQQPISKTLEFRQAGELYRSFSKRDRDNLVSNLAGALGDVRSQKIRDIMCSHFYKADEEYGMAVAEAVKCSMETVKDLASKLED